jgi:hypothetical protein
LADGWSPLDERERSRTFLARITGELPDTKYPAAATARLDNPADRRPLTCLGCRQPQGGRAGWLNRYAVGWSFLIIR